MSEMIIWVRPKTYTPVTTEIIDGPNPNQVIRAHFQMIRIFTKHIDVISGPASMISDPTNHFDGRSMISDSTQSHWWWYLYLQMHNVIFWYLLNITVTICDVI